MYINVHQLELFYHVAHLKSFSAAARRMNIGQPGVSSQLKTLEKEHGPLLDHDTFELTPGGGKLYDFISVFYSQIESVADQVRLNLGEPLRIGGAEVVLRTHMPDVAQLFRRRVPQGRLKLIGGSQQHLMNLLRRQEVDLVITELNNSLPRGVTGFPLIQLKIVVIVHRDFEPVYQPVLPPSKPVNALRKAGIAPHQVKDLLKAATAQGMVAGRRITSWDHFLRQKRPQEWLICPAETECVAQIFHAEMKNLGLDWPVGLEVSATESVTPLVLKKLGVGVTVAFPPLVNHPDLVIFDPGLPPITYGVVWRGKGDLAGKTMEAILTTARELWPDEPRLKAKAR